MTDDLIERLAPGVCAQWHARHKLCLPKWEYLPADVREEWRLQVQDYVAALRAEGFEAVPVEATGAMVRAAIDRGTEEPTMYHGIWRAMVAAGRVDGGGE